MLPDGPPLAVAGLPASYDPVLGLVLGAVASVPLAAATLAVARDWSVARAAGAVALVAALTTVGGLGATLLAAGGEVALVAAAASAHAAVQLVAATLVGRQLLRRATACGPDPALSFALAGLPVGHVGVVVTILLPDGGVRATLSAMEGQVGVAAWMLVGVLLLVTPGLVGVWLYRFDRRRS